MYIALRQGLTAPWGRNFDVNRNILSFRSFVASFKKIYFWGLILYIFHDFIHIYSSEAGADSRQATKFWCQQKRLVTSFICSKFQTNLFNKVFNDFIHRGSYIRGHLIWNYTTSFINFILTDHECKILFIAWPLQWSKTLKITQVRRSIAVWTTCGQWFCSIT